MSSVSPPTSKLPWGTILKPNFGLGHQKLTVDEVDAAVERLNQIKESKEPVHLRPNKLMTQDEISSMLERLTKLETKYRGIPDSDRRIMKSIYKDMGVLSSYAWKGYN